MLPDLCFKLDFLSCLEPVFDIDLLRLKKLEPPLLDIIDYYLLRLKNPEAPLAENAKLSLLVSARYKQSSDYFNPLAEKARLSFIALL